MTNLTEAIRAAFPKLDPGLIAPGLRLADCPGWDSMTAVNLLMEIGARCGCELAGYEPADGTTVAELAAAIRADGGSP